MDTATEPDPARRPALAAGRATTPWRARQVFSIRALPSVSADGVGETYRSAFAGVRFADKTTFLALARVLNPMILLSKDIWRVDTLHSCWEANFSAMPSSLTDSSTEIMRLPESSMLDGNMHKSLKWGEKVKRILLG